MGVVDSLLDWLGLMKLSSSNGERRLVIVMFGMAEEGWCVRLVGVCGERRCEHSE